MSGYIERCFAIRLPNITKDDENNYNLNYHTMKIKKRIEKGTNIKNFLSEICMDMCNIVTHKGTKIYGNLKVDDLPEDEILLISFDQFSQQHRYIEYLKESKDKKIKELESIISQERKYSANMRNTLMYIHNLSFDQQTAFMNNNNLILGNDTKRIKLNEDDGSLLSNYNNTINI